MEKQIAYQNRAVNKTTIWLLFLFLGWSYGSMNQIGKQILFYVTFGGFGIWALIRLFTLNDSIKEYNRKIAAECGFETKELIMYNLV